MLREIVKMKFLKWQYITLTEKYIVTKVYEELLLDIIRRNTDLNKTEKINFQHESLILDYIFKNKASFILVPSKC